MKSDAMILLCPGLDLLQDRGWRNADRPGQHDQLDNIDPTLAALDPGDQRLVTMQALGHPGLGQACGFPGVGQRRA